MFNKDKNKEIKQPKRLTLKQVEAEATNFDVHMMPAKFLGLQSGNKKSGHVNGNSMPGSNMKKNIIIGAGIVLIFGALMLVAAWLFLKSINQQSDNKIDVSQPPNATGQSDKLLTTQLTVYQEQVLTNTDQIEATTSDGMVDKKNEITVSASVDMSTWINYQDNQALFSVKYPPKLAFEPLQLDQAFSFSDTGIILGIGHLDIDDLDYAEKQIKETALRDRQILDEQGVFGEIFDSPLKGSQKIVQVADKNIKTFMVLGREDEAVVLERKAIFYNANYQVVIALQADTQSVFDSMPDYFTNQVWKTEGEYTQDSFYKLLTAGKASLQVQEWYDLFDQIISSLILTEQVQDQDTINDSSDIDGEQSPLLKEIPPMSQDNDGDHLTNVEEELYSSDPDKPDTDQDGYLDGDEVLSFYSPVQKTQTLESSGLIEAYLNTQYGYIIYYPSVWSAEEIDSLGETVMFTSETTEFVEVIVQENMTGMTNIRAWYLSQMAGIEPSKVVNMRVDGLDGVRSPDGMNVYLMKENLIYTISYNINLKEEANFMTTFEMMTQSFKLFDNPLE